MKTLPVLLKDGYKVGHKFQYPPNTTMVYSNLTPRSTRVQGDDGVIFFGLQAFILEYLIKQFDQNFFNQPKADVMKIYDRRITNYLGPTDSSHIGALHDLGYLPLKIKALPEGSMVPLRVPVLTIRNTHPDFFWLTNMLETLMSAELWGPSTSATTAFHYRKTFERYAELTGAPKAFVPWQGHDFSMRGMMGVNASAMSGAGHLLSFTGTDTIPAIDFLEEYYGADCEKELIGGSVPATEHSVMSMGMKEGEIETFKRLITEIYPKGIVSVVSDTWDFWGVIGTYLPLLREIILTRDGKLVIRPDSGDPVKIICGDPESNVECVRRGAIQCLWDVFGGRTNEASYKELDPHIGLIYGDSITRERQDAILGGLAAKGFASSNVVLGIGSYTYQCVTRDTYGWAMKATYGEMKEPLNEFELGEVDPSDDQLFKTVGQPIFKKPATDDGTKNSAKGLLALFREGDRGVIGHPADEPLYCVEDVDWKQEDRGCLETVFLDGELKRFEKLSEIRARVEGYL